jgi:membrane protein implicated in regulation of membrane protease activity
MREHDHDKARYRDHDIVFIEASIILAIALAIVLAMIGKRQRSRRSKRPDYKLESGHARNAHCTQVQDSLREVHGGKFMNVHRH